MQGSAAALCPGDGVTCPFVPRISRSGQILPGWSATHSSGARPPLWDPRAAPSEKSPASPPHLSSEVLRRWDPAKRSGSFQLSPGLLPSTSVLGSISAGNVPFHTSPELLCPPGCAWGGFVPHPARGWVSVPHPLPGRDLCPGGIPVLGTDISVVLFPFPKPHPGWQSLVVPQAGWGS